MMVPVDLDFDEDDSETLEKLVDRYGIQKVTDHLALICGFKEEHVRGNWQDEALARMWHRYFKILTSAAEKLE